MREYRPLGVTYTDVGGYEGPDVKRFLQKGTYAVKQDEQHASDHPVACLEPLRVRLVWVGWAVSIVASGLNLGHITVQMSVPQPAGSNEVFISLSLHYMVFGKGHA